MGPMRNAWHLLLGYGEVELKGMGLERALTQLEQGGLTLWNIRRIDRLTMVCCVPMRQKKLYRKLAAELPCRVTWKQERGVPGFVHRLCKRRALVLGLVVLVVGSLVSVQFVWKVEIKGIDDPTRLAEIYGIVEESGYGPGTWWHGIRLKEVERQLLLQLPDAAALVANRTGTTLELEIIPTVPAPELFTPGEPCDIVATEDGVIVSVTALEGIANVEAGQTVKKGDVLISGNIIREQGENRTVQARGEVVAKVNLTGSHTVSMQTEEPIATGEPYTTRILSIAGWEIPLERAPEEGEALLLETQERELCSVYLPARVITQRWQPVTVQTTQRSFAEAEQAAAKIATQNAQAQLSEGEQAESVVLQTTLNEDGSEMTVYAILQVQRQIGTPGALAPVPSASPAQP